MTPNEALVTTAQKTALYRVFDAGRRLLYVGISSNALRRMSQHRQRAEWFRDLAYIEVEWFATREEAAKAERAAIRREAPAFNIAHADGAPEPQQAAPPADATAPPPVALAGASFVGVAFHIFGPDRAPKYQGHIIGLVEGGYALAQLFSWLDGSPTTVRLFALADIVAGCARDYRSEGAWILHENFAAMRDWYDQRARMFEGAVAA